jgi:hypothetical protein
MSEHEYKEMIVPCKVCSKEFKLHLPMRIYEMLTADGEPMEFTGTCPTCRKDDPFLRMLDEANTPTIGRDFTEEI